MTVVDPQRAYKWNFAMWVVETALWMLATAFIDSTTVLPVLIQQLSGSFVLAGSILSFRYAGQGWPQLIAASLLSGKPYRKVFYLLVVIPGRLLLLWPALLLVLGITDPRAVVPAILTAYFAFWISEGFSIVPWVDMLGKTIPSKRRGRLFALMHILGGILGIGGGLLVRQLLTESAFPFPTGYGILFLLALATIALSTLALGLLREPPSPPHEERYSTVALIKDIPNLLRAMPQFRLLVILQALFGFSVLPAPLYILYAVTFLHGAVGGGAAEASLGVGVFLAIQTAGMIAGNAAWGHLGDAHGNRYLLRVLAIAHAAVPLFAALAGLVMARTPIPVWGIYLLFAPTFFLFGSLQGGTWMGVTNFLLELAPSHDRPAYIAVTNALNIPAVILPLLGGLLLGALGFTAIFLIAMLFLLGSFWVTLHLHEPREMLTHHHHPPKEPWE